MAHTPARDYDPHPAYQEPEGDLAVLRDHADKLTLRLLKLNRERNEVGGWKRRGLASKLRKLDAQLDAVCTCIELLTVNGNFARERSDSRCRVIAGIEKGS